jgi:hypothetical protein
MNALKQRLLAIAGLTLALTGPIHAQELTADDVAALPQDMVRKIIKECHDSNNLVLEDLCERIQLGALKRIVDRGTYQSGGSTDEKDDRNRHPARESLKALLQRPPSAASASLGTPTGNSQQIIATWKGAFVAAVRRCFNFPYNGMDADQFEADIDIYMRPDGTLASQPTIVAVRGPSASIGHAMAESVARAVVQCQAYAFLPKQQYDTWKYIGITFGLKDVQ